jgi:hypothetical protein
MATCSRSPISIRSHDLHADNVTRAVGEIASYREEDQVSSFFGSSILWFLQAYTSFNLSLAFPFVFCVMVLAISFYWIFVYPCQSGQKKRFKNPAIFCWHARTHYLNMMILDGFPRDLMILWLPHNSSPPSSLYISHIGFFLSPRWWRFVKNRIV